MRGAGSATSLWVKLEIIHFFEVQDRDLKWWLAKYKYKSGKLNVFFKNGKFLFFRRLVSSSKGVSASRARRCRPCDSPAVEMAAAAGLTCPNSRPKGQLFIADGEELLFIETQQRALPSPSFA